MEFIVDSSYDSSDIDSSHCSVRDSSVFSPLGKWCLASLGLEMLEAVWHVRGAKPS